MFKQLQQHWIFAVLMTFVIGWSSIASATQKPKHALMQEFISHTLHLTASQAPCHQQSASEQSHLTEHLDGSTCAEQTDAKHLACPDCAFWHAQLNILAPDVNHPELEQQMLQVIASQIYLFKPTQHLPGYWTEILRPPKA